MGTRVQMADLLPDRSSILESGWRRHIRVSDKSTHRTVLYARVEYYSRARSYCFVWRIWSTWYRTNALCSQRTLQDQRMDRRPHRFFILVDQHWVNADGVAESFAGGASTNYCQRKRRYVVRTFRRISFAAAYQYV